MTAEDKWETDMGQNPKSQNQDRKPGNGGRSTKTQAGLERGLKIEKTVNTDHSISSFNQKKTNGRVHT